METNGVTPVYWIEADVGASYSFDNGLVAYRYFGLTIIIAETCSRR